MTPFKKILERYRKYSFSESDKGTRFERLMQAYLLTDLKYASRLEKVWLWNQFPGKVDFGSGNDVGIDLVGITTDGEYWAIQCKCFQEKTYIDKAAVDSFLATSGRSFLNEEMKTTRFSQRIWISTSNNWSSHATDALKNQFPSVTRINIYDLIEAPVDWDKLDNGIHGEIARTPKKTLYAHQKEALDKAHEYYKQNDRGKLIMACGTGKCFRVPLKDEAGCIHHLEMCDYTSAGNSWEEGNLFRVWIQQPFDFRHLYINRLNWRVNMPDGDHRPEIPEMYKK